MGRRWRRIRPDVDRATADVNAGATTRPEPSRAARWRWLNPRPTGEALYGIGVSVSFKPDRSVTSFSSRRPRSGPKLGELSVRRGAFARANRSVQECIMVQSEGER